MSWLTIILSHLADYVRRLLILSDHPEAGWNQARRRFVVQLVTAVAMAGDVMFSSIVRHMPTRGVNIRHRYKCADRLLGEVDLVPVAAQQTSELGQRVGPRSVIALDLSDIRKRYGKAMEHLHKVHDGSTGEIGIGYGLATAVALDPDVAQKSLPIPLIFEVFSASEPDFKSQPAIWLDMIRRICAAVRYGTFAIDREGDNGRIIGALLAAARDFVIRLQVHENSRHLLIDNDSRARVRDLWEGARFYGELEATRLFAEGQTGAYRARYGSRPVRLPGSKKPLWLCVFKSPQHQQPLVLLTTHKADTPEVVCDVLSMYFARWGVEEVHRFAKQGFKLENIRALTWKRIQNLVAAVWIVLGAISTFCRRADAERALRWFEVHAQRLIAPLNATQFWGYALLDGLRASQEAAQRALALIPGFWSPQPRSPQAELFGGRA